CLLTLENSDFLRKWGFKSSEEQSKVHKTEKINKIEFVKGMESLAKIAKDKNTFSYVEKNREMFKRTNIKDFQLLFDKNNDKRFLLLDMEGKLFAVNEQGDEMKDSHIIKDAPPLTGIVLSKDRRWLAGISKEDGSVFLMNCEKPDSGWKKIIDKTILGACYSDDGFRQIIFSPDSKELVASFFGRFYFFSTVAMKVILSTDRIPLKGAGDSITYSNDGRFLFSFGNGKITVHDNINKTLFQNIKVPNFCGSGSDPYYDTEIVALKRGLGKDENNKAFVVASDDSTLRFYQFSEETQEFKQIYVVSPNEFKQLYGRFLYHFEGNHHGKLAISDDEKHLYVVFPDRGNEIRIYDMDEIRRNIDSIPERWKKESMDELTGLKYVPGKGISILDRNYMVEPKTSK
ncbi:MAG: hypothetical protein Q4G59_03815, partial [Planctomycetia bacterium]|nr:hypothetical protein [Planctomycetia bacterium]